MIIAKLTPLYCNGKNFIILNGATVFSNSNIAAIDAGFKKNCIYILSPDGEIIKQKGKLGLGKYKFKEPVGIFSNKDNLFVMDWHNQRVSVFDKNLNFIQDIGQPEFIKNKKTDFKIKKILKFFGYLLYTGSYIKNHFSKDELGSKANHKKRSLTIAILGFTYWINKHGLKKSINEIFNPSIPISKPNGIAFFKDYTLICNKNSRSISVLTKYKKNYFKLSKTIYGPTSNINFGRLANITYINPYLYICDEQNSTIWTLDNKFQLKDSIIGFDSGTGHFSPFSCCEITDKYIAICGGKNIQIYDKKTKKIVFVSENYGELHSVSYDKILNILYTADRKNGLLLRHKIII